MIWLLNEISEKEKESVGGKAFSLARMVQNGIRVPSAVCIGTGAYEEFVSSSGLHERIFMELSRKQFEEMRWEEIWDASLRIRNMFVNAVIPINLRDELNRLIHSHFGDNPTVIRSSAPGEDTSATSFAGLHESYVNVKGTDSILDHIRLVWASLWSDRALLYRRELGLRVESSAMAVVVQELVEGERSGIAFGVNPNDNSQGIIEAVHGLNQGLVDGTVEPDRWILARSTGDIISYTGVKREKAIFTSREGIVLKSLRKETSNTPPLNDSEVEKVFALTRKTERLFNSPQDVEWTFRRDLLYALQSRPITSGGGDVSEDKRSWYLSLTRSFENLKALRRRIEDELIPEMTEEAERLAEQKIEDLDDAHLASEIKRRMHILKRWEQIYEDEFIPFAHGARLFGQVYNDTMHPADPYEFTDLLGGTGMASIQRNEMLAEMAEIIRSNPSLGQKLKNHSHDDLDRTFSNLFDEFMERFGEFTFAGSRSSRNREDIVEILLQMASRERTERQFGKNKIKELTEKFLSHFKGDKKEFAADLLDLGRASYQLRDDDNIYIGRIESRIHATVQEARKRITTRGRNDADWMEPQEVLKALIDPEFRTNKRQTSIKDSDHERLRARQIVGQPAGSGIGTGNARVIMDAAELFSFKAGEILVCDAIDPNMTFIVPLAAGIVERRGGMLIHGAIVAREYGIPCVTGVANATSMIHNGQQVTVDGFLGIVIIGKPTLTEEDSEDSTDCVPEL